MKKTLQILSILLIVSILGVGCSDSENKTKEKDITEIETAEEIEEKETSSREAKEEIYYEKADTYATKVGLGIDEMFEIFENADLEDSFWQKDMKKIVSTIKTNANNIMEIENIPEKYTEVHDEMYNGMNYFDEAMGLMEEASEDNYTDDDLLFQIVDYIEIGNEYMETVDDIMNGTEDVEEYEDVFDEEFDEDVPVQEVKLGETFTMGKEEITVTGVELQREDWIIVDLTWTNNSEDTKSFEGAIGDGGVGTQAFQDGIALQSFVSEPTKENIMTDIKPGTTLENVKRMFEAKSDSEIELEFSYSEDSINDIDKAHMILDFPK